MSTGDYVFPATMKLSASQVEKLKNEDYGKGKTFEDWFTENDGVPVQFSDISLTVSGRSKKEVRVGLPWPAHTPKPAGGGPSGSSGSAAGALSAAS